MQMARISVIIPCYNSEKYIAKCINALSNQTYKDFDVIMIDDCSTDETLKVISDFEKKSPFPMKCLKNEINLGPARTRKFGVMQSNSEYIAFCDNGKKRADASQKFMEYITSDQSQKKLASLQMFSPALDIFDNGLHFEMQKALGRKLNVPNVFADKTVLLNQRQSAMQKVGL